MIDFKKIVIDYIEDKDAPIEDKVELYNKAIALKNKVNYSSFNDGSLRIIENNVEDISKRMNRDELVELVTKLTKKVNWSEEPYACITNHINQVTTLSYKETLEFIRNSVEDMLEYYMVGDESIELLNRMELLKISLQHYQAGKLNLDDMINRFKIVLGC